MTATFRIISYLSEGISWQPRLSRPVTAGIWDPGQDLETHNVETFSVILETNLVKMQPEPRRAFPDIGAQLPPGSRPGRRY